MLITGKNLLSSAIVAAVTCTIVIYSYNIERDNAQSIIEDGAIREVENTEYTVILDADIPLSNSIEENNCSKIENQIFAKCNEIRRENNLSELEKSSKLYKCAKVRAKEAAVKWSHTRPDGTKWYTVNENIMHGENLAFGYRTADEVVSAWMDSPTHKENILWGKFKSIAISVYERNGQYYIAQEFSYYV